MKRGGIGVTEPLTVRDKLIPASIFTQTRWINTMNLQKAIVVALIFFPLVAPRPAMADKIVASTDEEFSEKLLGLVDHSFDDNSSRLASIKKLAYYMMTIDYAVEHCFKWRDVNITFGKMLLKGGTEILLKHASEVEIERAFADEIGWGGWLSRIGEPKVPPPGTFYLGLIAQHPAMLCVETYYKDGIGERLFLSSWR